MKSEKVPTTVIVMWLRWVGSELDILDYSMDNWCQEINCNPHLCGNKTVTIKHCLWECPQWRDIQKKIQYPEQYKSPTGKGLWSGKNKFLHFLYVCANKSCNKTPLLGSIRKKFLDQWILYSFFQLVIWLILSRVLI